MNRINVINGLDYGICGGLHDEENSIYILNKTLKLSKQKMSFR